MLQKLCYGLLVLAGLERKKRVFPHSANVWAGVPGVPPKAMVVLSMLNFTGS